MSTSRKSSDDMPNGEAPKEETGKPPRSLILIAEFVKGYAKGWHFAVGECFKDELDIKYTPRKEAGQEVMRWTQGVEYHFAEGHLIYDTPKAYLQWSEALKHINCVCSVLSARPNKWVVLNKSKTETDSNKRKKQKKEWKLISGHVHFKISKPDAERVSLQTVGSYDLTQNEFVEFLKNGVLQGQPVEEILQSESSAR
jgi:hypothetical protein